MKDCDKIYIVFYLGVGEHDEIDIASMMNETIQSYNQYFDDTVKPFFIPVRNTDYTRVEILNPKYVSRNEFKKTLAEVRKTCKKMRAKFEISQKNDFFKLKF
jgi:predicted P-loop ATPase/GTPase